MILGSFAGLGSASVMPPAASGKKESFKKLVYIAIDGFHPAYVTLDSRGNAGGVRGNLLTPNIRAFLETSRWFSNARGHLPAATDMNHLNAMAGCSSAQTGIIGVWAQPASWDGDKAVLKRSHISFARDDLGRPVDTVFHAWKRKRPDSKTMMISGKEWVAEMFRDGGGRPAVDIVVTGKDFPGYLEEPRRESFTDPPTDPDAYTDYESGRMGYFDVRGMKWGRILDHMSPSQTMTRLYTGQGSLLTVQMEHFPRRFPHDEWVVRSALEVFRQENPDLAYILLAQCDDGGHCIGTAHDPSEFIKGNPELSGTKAASNIDNFMVSRRNPLIVREGVLDCIRDVDIQFGRLAKGLADLGILDDSHIVLLSDHSAVNHLSTPDFISTDVMGILENGKLETDGLYAFSVSSYGVLYFRERKKDVEKAKSLLLSHRAANPETGAVECPWWVLDRKDMQKGVPGVSLPGELYHRYYVDDDKERNMLWPDLVILAKNGWQIPVYNGHIPNVGISVPTWTPPWRVYNGGHGSVDTLPILAAVRSPAVKKGVDVRPVRISDLGATALKLAGLTIRSTVTGRCLV
jgi:predicted AlkP superfamily pyrophosphatase or phosphodiesterase